ncbi:MAG: M48 family metallopeptidase [Candidatus Electronema sp. VV]
MTDERFAAIVSEADELARTQPARYQRKMWCLILLGDLYLAAIAVVLLALQAGALCMIVRDAGSPGWQTALGIPVLIWAVWLTRKLLLMQGGRKPEVGLPLARQQAPELFALIDTLCCQADAPPLRQALITEAFNAGVEQLPRLGIFGWHQRKLLLGLPLLKCLTVEQCKAVLAHELGHLSKRGYGRLSRRVHYQMLRWTGLADTLGEDPHGYLFKHFLEWFISYLGACAFPLARLSEYEADALSVRLVSQEAAVETLSISNVIERYLEQGYWPQVRRLADELPEPVAPYRMMGRNLAAEVNAAWAEHCIAADMARKAGLTETHPSLCDRLNALQAAPRLALAGAGQNAERLLGSALQSVTEQMDREWQDKNRAWWTERHQRLQNNRRQFAELNARAASGAVLTVEEAYQRAQLTWSLGRDEDATLGQLLALYHRAAEHPLASFALGAWLLNRAFAEDKYDAEDGYALLEQAMRLDEGFTARCCEMLRDYCQDKGREEEAQRWDEKLKARLQLEEAAKQERSQVQ